MYKKMIFLSFFNLFLYVYEALNDFNHL